MKMTQKVFVYGLLLTSAKRDFLRWLSGVEAYFDGVLFGFFSMVARVATREIAVVIL